MPSVIVHNVFMFRCPMCGKASRVETEDVDEETAAEMTREAYGLEEWQEPDEEQVGGWCRIPDEVTCRHCKQSLKVKAVV